jgi:CubicO group peptidase (beta-lactamase class C family)
VRDDGPEVALPWALARTANPAGGLLSSVRDQLRYARFWLGDGTAANGTRVLSPASMREMQRPQAQMGLDASVGLAWMLRDADGVRIVAHGGATRGQISAFVMAPERRFAITVLTNADHGSELCNSVTAWALRELLGLHEPETTHLPASEPELAALAGTYTAALSDLELRLEAGALMLHVAPKAGFPTRDAPALPTPEPMRVAVCGPDRIVVLDAPLKASRGEFLRGPDGAIAWLRFGGRVRRRLRERAS